MKKNLDKNTIIEMLEKKKIKRFADVPEKFLNDKDIIFIQRKLGHRVIYLKGYDVINNEFFVEEKVVKERIGRNTRYDNRTTTFETFDEYYGFLEGNIYDNACYYQYIFTDEQIDKYKIQLEKINNFIELELTLEDVKPKCEEKIKTYFERKKSRQKIKEWIEKFNRIKTYEEFVETVESYGQIKDKPSHLDFFIWNYISKNKEKVLDIVVKYLSNAGYYNSSFIYGLCFMFGVDNIAPFFKYTGMAKSTNVKRNREFKNFIIDFNTKKYIKRKKISFDICSGYYYEQTKHYIEVDAYGKKIPRLVASSYEYFETFEEIAKHLQYDFSNCDFTDAIELPIEKIIKYNENTKFPVMDQSQLTRFVRKRYNRTKREFVVEVSYYTKEKNLYCSDTISFKYFFQFLAFLNNDISGADLIFCDGLKNVRDFSNLNVESAKVVSSIRKKALPNEDISNISLLISDYNVASEDEIKTSLILCQDREELVKNESTDQSDKIYYITDLHLEHRLSHAGCKTEEDCIYIIQNIIDELLIGLNLEVENLILVGGDTASSFALFELFARMLRSSLPVSTRVIFTLGNHELWDFSSFDIETITSKYRTLLEKYGMCLLQNEMLCVFDDGIKSLPIETNKKELKRARTIVFGGIGFSGRNRKFNATNGIYRNTVSRSAEIEESNKINNLYNRLCENLPLEKVIILTHTPYEDWCEDEKRHENYIYVSGHNHRNEYYDDGIVRIYSDNQIGYLNVIPKLKYFSFSFEYDMFEDYKDGIYEITKDEYREFYRGKNLYCNCNAVNQLYLLKKCGYYCFINKNKSGDLTIMNGGSKQLLSKKDIKYYFENMDVVVATLKGPYDEYYKAQLQIAKLIKKIGGSGKIHGAIIDIDYYNHIYLNPRDATITPYYAINIISKKVYPSLNYLLEDKCPELYKKYESLLESSNKDEFVIKNSDEIQKAPERYLSTDIYEASRILRKMQRMNSNILTIWPKNIGDTCSNSLVKLH